MRKGQQVAAYVDTEEGFNWLLVKIERKQGNGKYVVHDEFPSTPELERFTIDSSYLSIFPNTEGPYEVGEHILARWQNDDDDWTTELYDAEIKRVNRNNMLSLQYINSDEVIKVSTSMVTKYSEAFLHTEEEEEEEEEEKKETEEKAKKEKEEKPKKEKKEKDKKQAKEETKKEKDKKQAKEEKIEEPEKETEAPEHQEEEKETKTAEIASAEEAEPEETTETHESEESQPPVPEEIVDRKRDVKFLFKRPEYVEKIDLKLLEDDEIATIIPPPIEVKRMQITEGTPLLDCLEDPDLFDQHKHHTTSSGIVYREGFDGDEKKEYSSGLLNGESCGRLGKIFKSANKY